jgi:RNA polymerase sigma-70 factor (ECF subfamily)
MEAPHPSDRADRADRAQAFEHVVTEYEGPLLRYVTRILGDFGAAQDVVQDCFIKLIGKWREELRPGPALSSWLYRVAHNGAIDHVRKITNRHELRGEPAEDEGVSHPPDRGAAFRVTEDGERALRALRSLTPREQQLVGLKVFEEKSYREIAEITGLTTSNVGYILHFAMRKMAAALRRMKEDEHSTAR